MAATTGGSVSKAWFMSDDTGEWFDIQYNPTNFKFDKPVSWKEHDDQGQEGALEFQKATPATMSCELTFDTTQDSSDVRDVWVNKLLKMTNPEVPPAKGEAAELGKLRPHKVWFVWGDFCLLGVIESINATYIMFAADGKPLRAKVTVKMKEWKAENTYSGGGAGSYFDSAPVKLVTVGAGETITAVALGGGSTGGGSTSGGSSAGGGSGDWRQIAEDNNIDDPFSLEAGDELIVRGRR